MYHFLYTCVHIINNVKYHIGNNTRIYGTLNVSFCVHIFISTQVSHINIHNYETLNITFLCTYVHIINHIKHYHLDNNTHIYGTLNVLFLCTCVHITNYVK